MLFNFLNHEQIGKITKKLVKTIFLKKKVGRKPPNQKVRKKEIKKDRKRKHE